MFFTGRHRWHDGCGSHCKLCWGQLLVFARKREEKEAAHPPRRKPSCELPLKGRIDQISNSSSQTKPSSPSPAEVLSPRTSEVAVGQGMRGGESVTLNAVVRGNVTGVYPLAELLSSITCSEIARGPPKWLPTPVNFQSQSSMKWSNTVVQSTMKRIRAGTLFIRG